MAWNACTVSRSESPPLRSSRSANSVGRRLVLGDIGACASRRTGASRRGAPAGRCASQRAAALHGLEPSPRGLARGTRTRAITRSTDALEKIVLVLHVVVQGHRFDADLACDASHRHRLEPLGVHHVRARPRRSRSRVSGSRGFVGVVVRPIVSEAVPHPRVDTLTAYAYPAYTVSIHRTSRRAREGCLKGGNDEAQSRDAGPGKQPASVAHGDHLVGDLHRRRAPPAARCSRRR